MNDALAHLTLDTVRRLDKVVADTSSLIYAMRAGFLIPLTQTIRIIAPPGVFDELGEWGDVSPAIAAIAHLEESDRVYEGYQVDAQVVVAADKTGCAVLSDDLRLLARAAERGIAGYTVRVMLELMLLRSTVDLDTYCRLKRSLSEQVRYALPLYIAAEELHWEIRKETGQEEQWKPGD